MHNSSETVVRLGEAASARRTEKQSEVKQASGTIQTSQIAKAHSASEESFRKSGTQFGWHAGIRCVVKNI